MRFALDYREQRVWAPQALPGGDYHCPARSHARHALILRRRGTRRDAHFAHLPHSTCPWADTEDSVLRQMRRTVALAFAAEHVEELSARSMLINRHFVVEFAATEITAAAWRRRTRDHNRGGRPVLWVFDIALLDAISFAELEHAGPLPLPDALRVCQHASYTRLYICDRRGELRGCRLFKRDTGLYQLGASEVLRCERPALGRWQWREGYEKPLCQPLWHLHPLRTG